MKSKDMIYLFIAAAIFLVGGYIGYTQLVPKKAGAGKGVQVEVVGSIPAQLDSSGMSWLNNTSQVQDYDTPINLSSGLNNTSPFGQ